ncbi:hypothetical protein N8077_04300 [Myxococcota bacterium]|nr:hypothetical protein [Myxococcota bacterium]
MTKLEGLPPWFLQITTFALVALLGMQATGVWWIADFAATTRIQLSHSNQRFEEHLTNEALLLGRIESHLAEDIQDIKGRVDRLEIHNLQQHQ